MATGVTAVVMIVSGLRRMWRSDRPVRTAVSPRKCAFIVILLLARGGVLADDREEDLLERRLLLDVLDLRRGQQLLQLGERAVGDDAALVEDRDPVGELLGLVEVLRGQQDGRPIRGELLDGIPHLDARLRIETRGGFVEEHDGRVADQAHRDVEAPAHAA
nr:hypothetical protein GCM10025699_17730 [Microbacterium flavescens]